MKGKKIDQEHLSEFIGECLFSNKFSADEIAAEANNQIQIIDNKIREVIELKSKRSKLLDVVEKFSTKKDNSSNIVMLELFNITNIDYNRHICSILLISKGDPIRLENFLGKKLSKSKMLDSINKLLFNKVVNELPDGSYIVGEQFNNYVCLVLKGI